MKRWTVYTKRFSHETVYSLFTRFGHASIFVSIGCSLIFPLMVRVVLKWHNINDKYIFLNQQYWPLMKNNIFTEIKKKCYRTCTYMYSSLKRHINHSFKCCLNVNYKKYRKCKWLKTLTLKSVSLQTLT